MPKYLFQATYTSEGIKGLEKDKASGRKAALSRSRGVSGRKTRSLLPVFWQAGLASACGPARQRQRVGLLACGVRVGSPSGDDYASR